MAMSTWMELAWASLFSHCLLNGGSLDFAWKAIAAACNLGGGGAHQEMPGYTPEALSYDLVGSLPL